jgi:hypothetical protein
MFHIRAQIISSSIPNITRFQTLSKWKHEAVGIFNVDKI